MADHQFQEKGQALRSGFFDRDAFKQKGRSVLVLKTAVAGLYYHVDSTQGEVIPYETTHALYSSKKVNTIYTAHKQYEFIGWFLDVSFLKRSPPEQNFICFVTRTTSTINGRYRSILRTIGSLVT